MRRLAAMFLCAGLVACATTDRSASGEPEDPFVLQIDSGRLGIFVDRIGMASELDESLPPDATDLQNAAGNVREAAAAYFAAKERACANGRFVAQSCAPQKPPAWLAEAPNKPVSGAEVRRRIDEIYELTDALVGAACDYGREKSGDGLFCSVE